MSFICIGIAIGYTVVAIAYAGMPYGGGSNNGTDTCPNGYYCMKMADEIALQKFIDTRCMKLEHGKY